jgi:DNA helicase HerA-like ATPase
MTVLRDDAIFVGTAGEAPQYVRLDKANRHGLVTGATGTGKTVTLQILAEGFSRAGVPCFCADIKGDLSGLAVPGTEKEFLRKRADTIGLDDYAYGESPAVFWDLFGKQGHPIRTTVSEMGPLLLARLLDLSPVQEGVLAIVFRLADDEGLALLDLKDLRALVAHVGERASELSREYGLVSGSSVGAIQRALLQLEEQGGDRFFGEPAFAIADLMRTAPDGRGVVNVLAADELMARPRLYATFLLWLLSELFEELPEVGDPEKPKLVFFFDEAHLLFDEAPKALLEKVEQVTRLIRSKGVGIYYVTQNPIDIPDAVLGQLGNRIQHALRAYTPRDQKAVKTAANTFRPNPALDVATVITELGVGEALVSTLDEKGAPTMVERTLIRPPEGRLGPITPGERAVLMGSSGMGEKYGETVDRESAYELLARRAAEAADAEAMPADSPTAAPPAESGGMLGGLWDALFGPGGGPRGGLTPAQKMARGTAGTVAAEIGATLGRTVGGRGGARIGRALARGALGNLLRR